MGKYSVCAAVAFDTIAYSRGFNRAVGWLPGGNEGKSCRTPSHHPSSPVRPSIGATPAAFSLFAPGRDWLAARMEHMAFVPPSPWRQWHDTAPFGSRHRATLTHENSSFSSPVLPMRAAGWG